MNKLIYLLLISTLIISCHKNAVTGRRGLNIVPESEMRSMASQQYIAFLSENRPVQGSKDLEMVKRVGERISAAVNTYMAQIGRADEVANYKWEYNLVNENTANAWCMPGGKIVVYTGILPITQNENGLAVVMGHEVAHAIARHGNERMSQGLIQQLGGVALNVALANQPQQTQQLAMQAYGIGSQVGVMLPFSRKHELEADKMGLKFMALAGYNPQEAPAFWQRMSKLGGQNLPEILSTHPSDERRISDINKNLPNAMKYYKPH